MTVFAAHCRDILFISGRAVDTLRDLLGRLLMTGLTGYGLKSFSMRKIIDAFQVTVAIDTGKIGPVVDRCPEFFRIDKERFSFPGLQVRVFMAGETVVVGGGDGGYGKDQKKEENPGCGKVDGPVHLFFLILFILLYYVKRFG
ncbi:MAG: hypothetical protein WCC06_05335 [Candidatus Aminicenantales bacterium]